MKSTFTKIMIAAILAIVSNLAAEASYVHLASGGKLTAFETFDAAMEQANPRDTIFLTNPNKIEINITKPIVIIGNKSCIVDPAIDLNDTNMETAKVNIEGLKIYAQVLVKSDLGTLELKNCGRSNNGYTFLTRLESKIGRVIVDRCNIDEINLFYQNSIYEGNTYVNYKCNVENLLVRNSQIFEIYGSCVDKENLMIVNSYIKYVRDNFYGDLRNCLIYSTSGEGEREYCFNFTPGGGYTVNGEYKEVNLNDTDDLIALGFVGDDGTAAGPYGGDEPHYSLLPDVPTVDFENSNVEYDKSTKKLKIKVKVLKE